MRYFCVKDALSAQECFAATYPLNEREGLQLLAAHAATPSLKGAHHERYKLDLAHVGPKDAVVTA